MSRHGSPEVDGVTMTETDNDFELVVEYDEQFAEQVERGQTNPLAGLSLRVGEYDLTGAPEDQFYIDDYMFFNFRKLLGAVEGVVDGHQQEITFYNIPVDLVLDPNDDAVYVSLLNVRGKRENDDVPEGGIPISKAALIAGLVDAAEEFHEKVIQTNPELEDSEHMQSLREHIENAEQMFGEVSETDSA